MTNPAAPIDFLFDLRTHLANKFIFKSRQAWFPIWCHDDFRNVNGGEIERTYGVNMFKAKEIVLTTFVDGFQGVFAPKTSKISLGEKQTILDEMKTFTEWRSKGVYINDSKIFIRQVMNNGRYLSSTYANRDIPINSFVCHVGGRLTKLGVEEISNRLQNQDNDYDLLTIPLDYSILAPFFYWGNIKDEKLKQIEGSKDPNKAHVLETFVLKGNCPVTLSPSSFVKYARTAEESNVVLDYLTYYDAMKNVEQRIYFFLRSTRAIRREEEILLSPPKPVTTSARNHRGSKSYHWTNRSCDALATRYTIPILPIGTVQPKTKRSKRRESLGFPMQLRSERPETSREPHRLVKQTKIISLSKEVSRAAKKSTRRTQSPQSSDQEYFADTSFSCEEPDEDIEIPSKRSKTGPVTRKEPTGSVEKASFERKAKDPDTELRRERTVNESINRVKQQRVGAFETLVDPSRLKIKVEPPSNERMVKVEVKEELNVDIDNQDALMTPCEVFPHLNDSPIANSDNITNQEMEMETMNLVDIVMGEREEIEEKQQGDNDLGIVIVDTKSLYQIKNPGNEEDENQ